MTPIPVQFPSMLYFYLGILLVAFLIARWSRLNLRQAGWHWGGRRTLMQAFGWGGLLATLGLVWLRYLLQTGRSLPIPVHPSPIDYVMLVAVIPCAEEIFFRGVVFGSLQRKWSLFWALLLSSEFSVICLPMQGLLALIFLNGIGYALSFRISGSLAAPIIAHIFVAAALLAGRIYPDVFGTLQTREFAIAGAIFLFIILLGAMKKSKG